MENNDDLKYENDKLKQRINELEQHLKKYTNSKGHQEYYEKNKFNFDSFYTIFRLLFFRNCWGIQWFKHIIGL